MSQEPLREEPGALVRHDSISPSSYSDFKLKLLLVFWNACTASRRSSHAYRTPPPLRSSCTVDLKFSSREKVRLRSRHFPFRDICLGFSGQLVVAHSFEQLQDKGHRIQAATRATKLGLSSVLGAAGKLIALRLDCSFSRPGVSDNGLGSLAESKVRLPVYGSRSFPRNLGRRLTYNVLNLRKGCIQTSWYLIRLRAL